MTALRHVRVKCHEYCCVCINARTSVFQSEMSSIEKGNASAGGVFHREKKGFSRRCLPQRKEGLQPEVSSTEKRSASAGGVFHREKKCFSRRCLPQRKEVLQPEVSSTEKGSALTQDGLNRGRQCFFWRCRSIELSNALARYVLQGDRKCLQCFSRRCP